MGRVFVKVGLQNGGVPVGFNQEGCPHKNWHSHICAESQGISELVRFKDLSGASLPSHQPNGWVTRSNGFLTYGLDWISFASDRNEFISYKLPKTFKRQRALNKVSSLLILSDAQWISMGKKESALLFGWLSLKGNPSRKKRKKGWHWATGYLF